MSRDVSIRLNDISDNMERAERFVGTMDYTTFEDDEKTHFAVIRCIEIIGEAVKNIPDEFRVKYPEINWTDMAGMRDKVIHSYFVVDLELVWLVVKEDIPKIKPLIEKIIKEGKL